MMRTTLTLDDDVFQRVREEMRCSGQSLKATVNDLLRLALAKRAEPRRTEPFEVESRSLGLRPGLSYDNVAELLETAEGPLHK